MRSMNWITKSLLVLGCAVLFAFTSSESDIFVQDLSNTEWYIMVWDINIHPNAAEIEFKKEGILSDERYDSNGKKHVWEASGNEVVFTVNDEYVTYKGKLTSSSTMVGKAKNLKGNKWKWFAIRIN